FASGTTANPPRGLRLAGAGDDRPTQRRSRMAWAQRVAAAAALVVAATVAWFAARPDFGNVERVAAHSTLVKAVRAVDSIASLGEARAVAIARTKLAPGDRSRTEALLALAEVQADANAAATLAELLDGIALAPEPMTWQELRAHERLAAITADPGESAREHATTRHLRARLAAEESEALARLNGWLADGPAYR
ncbi:MAG: hypothetical protein J0L88_13365, partial [Xanthomonadales bacterium]|nr:hypothetical protein [Xanthomonadales bacterium]